VVVHFEHQESRAGPVADPIHGEGLPKLYQVTDVERFSRGVLHD
jgi:hypothetical protein